MTPHSKSGTGVSTTWVYGTGVVTDTPGIASWEDILTGGAVLKGDFKNPNPHGYSVLQQKFFRGRVITSIVASGADYSETSGPIGAASNQIPHREPWIDYRSAVYNSTLAKLNGLVRGGLDLGVGLAEIGSTKRMIFGMNKTIDFARRLSTKDIANGWLQWQYGWRPLLSDVFGAADESIRFTLNKIEQFRARTTFPVERALRRPIVYNGNFLSLEKIKGKASCTIQLQMEVKSFDLARWTSLNPISLGWELIPYSFVVDWFVDVGSYLRDLETGLLYNTSFKKGFVSELFYYENDALVPGGQSYVSFGNKYRIEAPLVGYVRELQFSRSVLNAYPLPRLPSLKLDLGSKRLFSAAALLRQLLR